MPSVPAPEMVTNIFFPLLIKFFSCLLLLQLLNSDLQLLSMDELREKRLTDPRLPR